MNKMGIGYHKGYDIYMGFTKWKIAKANVQRPERFTTYKDATDYIDEYLLSKEKEILNFLSHANNILTVEMKKIFLTTVGYKQVEKTVMLSNIFYVLYGNYLLLVPFYYMKNGKMLKKGLNLYSFLQKNRLTKIREIYKKDVSIINGRITKNNITVYDCSKIQWARLLNASLWQKYMKNKDICLLDN